MHTKKSNSKTEDIQFGTEIQSGNPREMPDSMKTEKAIAYNQNKLSIERTELSKIRTELSFTNSHLSADRTHLAYLRTIVTLIGSGATIYKALPLLGVSFIFTLILTIFLFLSAIYFIYKDATTYPKIKRHLYEMEKKASELTTRTENTIYRLEDETSWSYPLQLFIQKEITQVLVLPNLSDSFFKTSRG